MNHWETFHKYYQWEFDIICEKQKGDVQFWKKMAHRYGNRILELGCGAGRISIPLVESGCRVTAIDLSENMISELKRKSAHLPGLSALVGDMTDYKLEVRFPFAFISYSSFQLLLTAKQQEACLRNVHDHLEDGGVLGLDLAACVCEGDDVQTREPLYTADFPEDNSQVTMFSSYKTDRLNFIRYWEDEYVHVKQDGSTISRFNKIALRDLNPDYMKLLLEKCGFRLEHLFGDFDESELNEDSFNALYLARKV